MPDLVPVRVRDCACPDAPHADGDIVYLTPTLGIDGGILAEQQMLEGIRLGDDKALARMWVRTFVTHGATGWNLLDELGLPVPFDVEVILGDWRLARVVADRATDLYQEAVLAPFQNAQEARSPTGRTASGTSRTRAQTKP
jgi:hypothetical protein